MSEVKFKLAAGTNVGLIRTKNEDNFVVCPDLSTSQWLIPQGDNFADLGPYGALLVVADGMGGANAGEVASAIAVKTIEELFVPDTLQNVVNDEKAIQRFMSDVVKAADLKILNRSNIDSSTQGMGTTVVMAWVLGTRAYVCWCGDSRCYALRRCNNQLVQVSKDHSYVQELVDRGELAPEYMHDHPLSNVITRCLGDVDKRAQPETRVFELYDGDTILLCSDGLSGLILDEEIAHILNRFDEHLMECKNELISAALNNGGHDNVTVAICTVKMDNEFCTANYNEPQRKTISEKEQLRATVIPVPITDSTVETQDEPVYDPASNPESEPEKKDEKIGSEVEDGGKSQPSDGEDQLSDGEHHQSVKDNEAKDDTDAKQQNEASNETTQDGSGKEKENEENEDKEVTSEKDEEITKKPAVNTSRHKGKRIVLIILLLLVIVAVCCIYLLPEGEPIRQYISECINKLTQQLNK